MATLTGNTVQSTYKDLLQVSNSNNGVTTTMSRVEDGEGTESELYLQTGAAGNGVRVGSSTGRPLWIGGSSRGVSPFIVRYGSGDGFMDVPSSVTGTAGGLMIGGTGSGHIVAAISANDNNDGFHVVGPTSPDANVDAFAANWMSVCSDEMVVNESSRDMDFRVESNSNTHMLFVDAGDNRVGINTAHPEYELTVSDFLSSGISYGGGGVINICKKGVENVVAVGAGQTSNKYAYLDLCGDSTYNGEGTAGGLRLLRGNGGANTYSQFSHRGTGYIEFIGEDQTGTGSSVMYFTQGVNATAQNVMTLAKGENTLWVNHTGTSSTYGAIVANLSAMRTESAGFVVNYSTEAKSTQAYYLTASNAFEMWNGWEKTFRINGNASIDMRGHIRMGDGNGSAVIQSISGGTSNGSTMTYGDTNGDIYFRIQRDSNNFNPFHSTYALVTDAATEPNTYSAAQVLSIEGRSGSAGNPRGTVTFYSKIKPSAANTYDCGSNAAPWDNVYAQNTTIQTSDQTLKDNISDSSLGLTFIKSLRPVSYKWKDRTVKVVTELDNEGNVKTEVDREYTYARTHYGLIAQEVKSTLDDLGVDSKDFAGYVDPNISDPETLESDEDGTLSLRYTEFIAPMIKAIQELEAKVADQEDTITKLKAAASFAAFKTAIG